MLLWMVCPDVHVYLLCWLLIWLLTFEYDMRTRVTVVFVILCGRWRLAQDYGWGTEIKNPLHAVTCVVILWQEWSRTLEIHSGTRIRYEYDYRTYKILACGWAIGTGRRLILNCCWSHKTLACGCAVGWYMTWTQAEYDYRAYKTSACECAVGISRRLFLNYYWSYKTLARGCAVGWYMTWIRYEHDCIRYKTLACAIGIGIGRRLILNCCWSYKTLARGCAVGWYKTWVWTWL